MRFADTYISFALRGLPLRKIARRYASWLLGTDHERSRARRIAEGVDPSWTIDQLLEGASVGERCRLDLRTTEHELLVRYAHDDDRDRAIRWVNVARIREHDGRVTLEHAVGREAPDGHVLFGTAAVPRVVTSILEADDAEIFPRQLRTPLVSLRGDDAREWVEQELLSRQRECPWLVIACERDGGAPPCDPVRVADRLRGVAAVAFLSTPRGAFAFADALRRRDLGRDFHCEDGAAHLYGKTDHRLWLGDTLFEVPQRDRDGRLAGAVSRRIALTTMPAGFFDVIAAHDRLTLPLEERVDAERRALERLDEEKHAAERSRDDLEGEVERLRTELASKPGGASTNEHAAALAHALLGEATPLELLTLVADAFPRELRVLDTAWDSARRARDTRNAQRLGAMLALLATAHHRARSAGQPEDEAAAPFGDAYVPGRAPARVDVVRESELAAWPRLQVGAIRVCFTWVPAERKIAIAWCG